MRRTWAGLLTSVAVVVVAAGAGDRLVVAKSARVTLVFRGDGHVGAEPGRRRQDQHGDARGRISPTAKSTLLSPHPTFSWPAVPKANKYTLTLYFLGSRIWSTIAEIT